MAEVRFEGEVDAFSGDLTNTSPVIGDRHVLDALHEHFDLTAGPNVRVTLGVEPAGEGPLRAYAGFGGTDVTPADPPQIMVGDLDLLRRLYDLDGRHVILIVESAE